MISNFKIGKTCFSENIFSFRNCTISIDHLSPADYGKWTCRVYHSASKQWQEAHLQVGAKDDTNVRLPTNIKPSR